jgi:hypothetical protein
MKSGVCSKMFEEEALLLESGKPTEKQNYLF